MSVANRVVLDFPTSETLSQRQLNQIAKHAANSLRAVDLEDVDHVIRDEQASFTPTVHAHTHSSSERVMCQSCVQLAQDEITSFED